MLFAARAARYGAAITTAAREFVTALGTAIKPTSLRARQINGMARFWLPDGPRFGSKLGRVTAGQTAFVQPQDESFRA